MGQAGAQREPSMEEILASIRRIIENNETDLPPEATSGQPEPDFGIDGEADERTGDATGERANVYPSGDDHGTLEIFSSQDAGQGGGRYSVTPANGRAEDVRPGATRSMPTPSVDEHADDVSLRYLGAGPGRTSLSGEASSVPEATDSGPVSLADVAARMRTEPPLQPASEADPETEKAPLAQLRSVLGDTFGSGEQPVAQKQDDVATSAVLDAVQNQLISVDAGAKVAASFEALDQAVAAGNLRGFDEIAEELLRPMLQSWLDDNLPTLVERLVREEIERVARGPRR